MIPRKLQLSNSPRQITVDADVYDNLPAGATVQIHNKGTTFVCAVYLGDGRRVSLLRFVFPEAESRRIRRKPGTDAYDYRREAFNAYSGPKRSKSDYSYDDVLSAGAVSRPRLTPNVRAREKAVYDAGCDVARALRKYCAAPQTAQTMSPIYKVEV